MARVIEPLLEAVSIRAPARGAIGGQNGPVRAGCFNPRSRTRSDVIRHRHA